MIAAARPGPAGLVADGRQLAVTGAAMLGVAAALPLLPGLPGVVCPLRALTGVPCPLCGMTTSVVAAVHLRFGEALAANPAGLLVVIVAVFLLIRRPTVVTVPLSLAAAGLAAMWLFELHRFGFL